MDKEGENQELKYESQLEQKDEFDPGNMELPGEQQADNKQSSKFKRPRNWGALGKKLAIVLICLVVLAGVGFGIYKLFIENNDKSSPNTQSTTETQQPEQNNSGKIAALPLTETYTNSTLRLELKYPQNWTVTEDDRSLKIESPPFTYETKDQGQVQGNFRIYIRKGAQSADGKYLGDGYAIAPSEKISYNEPASGQRDDTFLTAFGLKQPDNFAYFVVQGNFELDKGETLGPDFAKEIDAFLITGGYSEANKQDGMDTNQLNTEAYANSVEYVTAVEIVKSLKLK